MQGAPIGQGGPFPQLPFDGVSYRQLPTLHFSEFVGASGPRSAALWLLTLDIDAGMQNEPTVVAVDWWNEAEDLFSASHEDVCQSLRDRAEAVVETAA